MFPFPYSDIQNDNVCMRTLGTIGEIKKNILVFSHVIPNLCNFGLAVSAILHRIKIFDRRQIIVGYCASKVSSKGLPIVDTLGVPEL